MILLLALHFTDIDTDLLEVVTGSSDDHEEHFSYCFDSPCGLKNAVKYDSMLK